MALALLCPFARLNPIGVIVYPFQSLYLRRSVPLRVSHPVWQKSAASEQARRFRDLYLDPLNTQASIQKLLGISVAAFSRMALDLGAPIYKAVVQKSAPGRFKSEASADDGFALYRNEDDLIRKLSLVGGFRLNLEFREFPEAFQAIASGAADFGALMMCKTPERSLVADFSHKYVLQNKASAALIGLNGRAVLRSRPVVGILKGTVHVTYAHFALCPSFDRRLFADVPALTAALAAGDIDYVLIFPLDLPDIEVHPNKYRIIWKHALPYETCLPITRGREDLRQSLNSSLRELYDQGQLTQPEFLT